MEPAQTACIDSVPFDRKLAITGNNQLGNTVTVRQEKLLTFYRFGVGLFSPRHRSRSVSSATSGPSAGIHTMRTDPASALGTAAR